MNGTKVTASLVERLSRLPLAISVSLDTLDREQYRQIRGADQLLQVFEGIALLKEFPHPKFLTCIVSEANRTEVPAVVRFAQGQGFLPVVGAYHWNVGTYGRPDALLMYDRITRGRCVQRVTGRRADSPRLPWKFVEDNVSWLRLRAPDCRDHAASALAVGCH